MSNEIFIVSNPSYDEEKMPVILSAGTNSIQPNGKSDGYVIDPLPEDGTQTTLLLAKRFPNDLDATDKQVGPFDLFGEFAVEIDGEMIPYTFPANALVEYFKPGNEHGVVVSQYYEPNGISGFSPNQVSGPSALSYQVMRNGVWGEQMVWNREQTDPSMNPIRIRALFQLFLETCLSDLVAIGYQGDELDRFGYFDYERQSNFYGGEGYEKPDPVRIKFLAGCKGLIFNGENQYQESFEGDDLYDLIFREPDETVVTSGGLSLFYGLEPA